jgi:hypothetical protein
MGYLKKFKELESSYRPRHKFKHEDVVSQIGNLISEADDTIQFKNMEITYLQREVTQSYRIGTLIGIVVTVGLSILIGGISYVVLNY